MSAAKEYLEWVLGMNQSYLDMHNHEPGACHHCDITQMFVTVAESMIRDEDYDKNDFNKTVLAYNQNVGFMIEQYLKHK